MITPHQMDLWSSTFSDLYNSLEGEIIRQIIKRLNNGKKDIHEWQAQALAELHLFNADVVKLLAGVTDIGESEIRNILEEAGHQMIAEVDQAMPYETKPLPTGLDDIIRNYSNQAWSSIDNLVNQTLVTTNYGMGTATQAYQQVLNQTQALFNTGMLTMDEALERSITELSQQGIKATFKDKGGHSWSMERYVRTVLKSTLANTYNELRTERMSEYGCYTVVVTSHMGSRLQCSRIQGQVVDLRPMDQLPPNWPYRSVYDPYWNAWYGTAGGHRGVNCGHMWIPFISGVNTNNQPQYDPEENAKVASLRGRQSQMERQLIKLKKNKMVADELGDTKESEKLQKRILGTQKNIRNLVNSNEYLSRNYHREKVYTPLSSLVKEHQGNVIIKKRKPDIAGFNRHIRGTKEYDDYVRRGTQAGQNPSILTAPKENIIDFVSKNVPDEKFVVGKKFEVDFKKVIGVYVDQTTGEMIDTTRAKIHVGKNGYHVVPTRPR